MHLTRRTLLQAAAIALPASRALAAPASHGTIKRLDPALDAILDVDTPIEMLASGLTWCEGPVWVSKGDFLLFSDVPANRMWRWCAKYGAMPFLEPSGLAGPIPKTIREAGSNGLALDHAGRLLIADSGNRSIDRLDIATKTRTTLAGRYEGKRFNSCNDLIEARSGAIYFTDPPYGLADGDDSPLKELPFNGVYRLAPDGSVVLIDKDNKRPNGIGIAPDQRTLYVSKSEEAEPRVLAYTLDAAGMPTAKRVFRDMADDFATGAPGLPDGMTVHRDGHVFASGPGGIHILSAEGQPLGLIATGKAIANCCFGGKDGRTLFMTSSDMVVSLRIKTRGI